MTAGELTVSNEGAPRSTEGFASLGLAALIVRNLEQMGYRSPRPIQAQCAQTLLSGRDLMALAQTGTGKTAAFIAPLSHRLLLEKPPRAKGRPIQPMKRLRAVVLVPTRELARQVAKEASAIVQGSVLRVACAYGKSALAPQAQAISRGVDLLVATPGRVRELLDAAALSLAYARFVVIDEADRMLDMGFLPQVESILEGVPASRQTLLFSATMPTQVEDLARRFLNDPQRIEVGRQTTPVPHVEQHVVHVEHDDKVPLLLHLAGQGLRRGLLIFCNTKRRVGWVGTALARNRVRVGMLHGDRSQPQRLKALDRFANGELGVLVATDVAARGLHVPAVQTVINYDVPLTAEDFVHRIGRAAHGGPPALGRAYTFVARDDWPLWRDIAGALNLDLKPDIFEGFAPSAPRRHRRGKADVDRADRGNIDGASKRRKDQAQRRSRKSRPIKKGQKPGRGVVRLKSDRNQ